LQVTGYPGYGLPWGRDRLVPIFLATLAIQQQAPRITFDSAAQMLDTFAMQQGGTQYRRLAAAFQRIFGVTIFFGTDSKRERAAVVQRARFNFMSEAPIGSIVNFEDLSLVYRTVKKRVWLAKGYGLLQSAWRTLQGIETVNMIGKGRVAAERRCVLFGRAAV
jgi:hypothetical protein